MAKRLKRVGSAKRTKPTKHAKRVTPEVLLKLVGVGDPQMSPDGRQVLFMRKVVGAKNAYETTLWMADAQGRSAPRQLTHGPKDSSGRWSPDGARIAFVRADAEKPSQIAVLPADGGEAQAVTTLPEGSIRDLAWSPDGGRIAFSWRATEEKWTKAAAKARTEKGLSTPPREIDDIWYRLDGDGYFDGQRYHLHLLDVEARTTRVIFDKDTTGGFTYDWSPDGGALVVAANTHARAMWESAHARLYVVSAGKGKTTVAELRGQVDGPKTHPRWSPDGGFIAYAGRKGREGTYSTKNLELWVYDLAKKRARSLTEKTDYCLLAATLSDCADAAFEPQVRWAADSRALFMRIGWHGSGHIASVGIDGAGGRGPGVVFHTESGMDHALGTLSDDGTRIACVKATPTQPAEICVLEVAGRIFMPRRLTKFNDALVAGLALAVPEEKWVRAKDGHKVQAWVMRPAGARAKRGPAILEVHGGPHAQYGLTFFLEFQVLCAQGYTVWFSNPRGSKGYGQKHTAAIHGVWGTKDWVDIQAVTATMKRDKATNARKMGIMGGSYGGYMTNWAIGHTNEFAGAITDRCVSNLISMAGNSDFPEVPDEYWQGAVWDRPQAMWKSSPIAYFKNVKTPTLVIHSEGDLRCNIEQGEQVYTALCTLKVPTRFVRYPRETSHGMSRGGPPDLRLHRLGEIINWWKRWVG